MIKNWKDTLLPVTATVRDAAKMIDSNHLLVAIIADESHHLIGMITDADIRRALLEGSRLEDCVDKVMNSNPQVISMDDSEQKVQALFQKTHFRHLPIVDAQGRIVGLRLFDEKYQTKGKENWVVLMAGGLGSRLGSLTEQRPKPLLEVGNKPLLETILENFVDHGFINFYISVNYKAEMIEEYFGNGDKWGVNIQYLREKKRLGTAGSLSLLQQKTNEPIIVMNGDVLTKINIQMLLDFHNEHAADATMCITEYDLQVPYGVVNVDQHHVVSIEEKPIQRFFVNAGIYVLAPKVLQIIPQNKYFEMPTLFEFMKNKSMETMAFPIREYWLDIGQLDDFRQANNDYHGRFLPGLDNSNNPI